jgi:hypothetical protein
MVEGTITCTPPAVDERVSAQHRRIRALARELERTMDLQPLAAGLPALRALLAAHFVLEEESGGFYDTVRSTSPHLATRVDQLQAEHGTLLSTLDALARRTDELLELGDALYVDVRVLTHRLAQHESDEDEVMHASVNVDLGRGA